MDSGSSPECQKKYFSVGSKSTLRLTQIYRIKLFPVPYTCVEYKEDLTGDEHFFDQLFRQT